MAEDDVDWGAQLKAYLKQEPATPPPAPPEEAPKLPDIRPDIPSLRPDLAQIAPPVPPAVPQEPTEPVDYGKQLLDYLHPPPDPEVEKQGILSRLAEHSWLGMKQFGLGVAGITEKALGDDQATADIMSTYLASGKRAEEIGPRYTNLEDLRNHGTVGDWLNYLEFKVGDFVPDIATMVATGGVGSFATKLAVKGVAEGVLAKEVPDILLQTIGKRAALVGQYAAAASQEASGIAGEQYQATGDIHPGIAVAAGAVAGVPAVMTPMALGARFGLPESLASKFAQTLQDGVAARLGNNWVARRLGGAVGYGLESGVAGAAQAAVESTARSFVDQNYNALGPEAANRILEGAVNGTFLGGLIGTFMPARDPHIAALEDHIRDTLDGRDSGLAETNPNVTPKTESLKKWLPESTNESVEKINQVIREHIGEEANLKPWERTILENHTQTLDSLNLLKSMIEHHIQGAATNKEVVSDNGVPMRAEDATVDLKNQTVTVSDRLTNPEAPNTKTIPLSEFNLRDLATEAIKHLDKTQGSWMSLPTDIAKGFGKATLADRIGGQWAGIAQVHQGDPVIDHAGNPVDISKGLKPGQIVFSHNPNEQAEHPIAPETRKAIADIFQRRAPGASVILDTRAAGTNPASPSARDGFAAYAGDGHYYIFLPTKPTPEKFTTTAFHEMGHVISWENFRKLPVGTKQLLYQAYSNTLKDFADKDLMGLVHATMQPQYRKAFALDPAVMRERYLKWFNFDEWMAEGVATHLAYDREANTVEKYFGDTSRKILATLEDMKLVDPGFKPSAHEAMAGWLDTLYKHDATAAPMLLDGVLKSSDENAKALGLPLDPSQSVFDRVTSAPPASPSAAGVAASASAGLIPTKIKAQVDKFSAFTRWMWNTIQVAKLNPHIEPLRRLADTLGFFHADRMGWSQRTNDALVNWRRLGKESANKLGQFLFDMDKMAYLKPGEARRWATGPEMSAMWSKLGASRDQVARIMPVYTQIRTMFFDELKRMEDSAIEKAQTIRDLPARTARINDINKEFQTLRSGPYFPHSRYGDYAVAIRDSKGKLQHYELAWTQRDAQQRIKEVLPKYRAKDPGVKPSLDKIPGEVHQFIGLPSSVLESLRNLPDMTAMQQRHIDDLIYQMSPANSFVQRMQRRKNIAGYDMNAPRSFASHFNAASGYLARAKFGDQINQAVSDLAASKDNFDPLDIKQRARRTEMAEWAQKEADYILHPPNEHVAIKAFAFQWWLGFNPSTAFVHLMQMPMFTAPYMSKYYGLGGVGHLMKAYGDMRQLYRDPTKSTLEPGFVRTQTRAQHEGILTENRGVDMAALTNYGLMARSLQGTKYQQFISGASQLQSMFMRTVEKNNRLVTLRAAWNAAMADPMNPRLQKLVAQHDMLFRQLVKEGETPREAAAYIGARDAVRETHFQYTQVARPRWQRGILSPVMTFMMYKQQALWFFMHNPAGLRSLAMLTAVSGVTGLPLEQDLSNMIKWIGEWAGYRFDPNEELRKQLAELDAHPETIMHGFGRTGLGMPALFNAIGLPAPIGDVSRRLGYGDLVPGVQEFTRDQKENFYERFGNTMANMLGAGIEVPINLANAVSQLNGPYTMQKLLEGDYFSATRGLEPVMPSVLRNINMATRYFVQGGDVTRTGAMPTPMDMTDSEGQTQALARLVGFASPKVARVLEEQDERSQVLAYWVLRKTAVMKAFVDSRIQGGKDTMQYTSERVQAYNQEVPPKFSALRIKAAALIEGIKRQRIQNMLIATGRDKQGITPEIMQQFPELQKQMEDDARLSAPPPEQQGYPTSVSGVPGTTPE